MDKFQNDPTYEYRKSVDRPDLAVNEISMHSCTDYVLHNELTRKKDGALYHTIDKNEFWYDWKGKRYKLSWLGADTSDLQKQIDAIKKQVAALDGNAAAEAIENAKKALTLASDAKKTAEGLSDQINAAVADAAGAKSDAANAVTVAGEAKTVAESLSDQINAAVADAADAASAAANAVTVAGEAKTVAESLSNRVDTIERTADVANDKATEAMAVAYDAKAVAEQAKAAAHTHDNKSELDLIATGDKAKWDAATTTANEVRGALETLEEYANDLEGRINIADNTISAHINDTTDKKHISVNQRMQWNEAYDARHTHDNKATLDGIGDSDVDNWDAAYAAIHTHTNMSVITAISQGDIDRWNTVASSAGVSSINGKSGALTLKGGAADDGSVNLSISDSGEISAVLVGSFESAGAAAAVLGNTNDTKDAATVYGAKAAVTALSSYVADNYIASGDYGTFPDSDAYTDYPDPTTCPVEYARVQDVVKFVNDILKKNETVTDTGKEYLYINALKISAIDEEVDASLIPSIYQFVEYEITPDADGSFEIIVVCNQEIEGYAYDYAVDYGSFVTIDIPSTYEIIDWKVVGITGWEDPVTPFGLTNPKYAKRMYGSVEYSSYVRTLDYAENRLVNQRYKITIKKK